MLKIGLVRHAKSSWTEPSLGDHDRPLNSRGIRDAPIMAKKINTLHGVPDLILSSTAVRALNTANVFRQTMGISEQNLIPRSGLYHASEEDILDAISMLDEAVKYALIFGHNPTMTFLGNSFKGDVIENVPTCGVIILESTAKNWMELDTSNTKRVDFIYPKMYVQ